MIFSYLMVQETILLMETCLEMPEILFLNMKKLVVKCLNFREIKYYTKIFFKTFKNKYIVSKLIEILSNVPSLPGYNLRIATSLFSFDAFMDVVMLVMYLIDHS